MARIVEKARFALDLFGQCRYLCTVVVRIFHMALAALLFVAQGGLVVHQHFCKDQLMAARLFVQAPSCHQTGADDPMANCPVHGKQSTEDKDCCDDTAEHIAADISATAGSPAQWDVTESPFYAVAAPPLEVLWTDDRLRTTGMTPRINAPPPEHRHSAAWLQIFRC